MFKGLLPKGKKERRILFGPAAGCVMPLDLQYEMRILLGIYERELLPHYRRVCRSGMKSFDVGGRDGYSALLIHGITRADVISFEAEEKAVEEMTATFRRNSEHLRAMHAFVGPGFTLDQASQRYFRPDFIKIDVEGGEVDVLRTGPEVLSSRPSMIIEVHGLAEERGCIDLLRPLNYRIDVVNPSRFMPEHRPLAHNRWLICSAG
jgi:hypothetical protein